MRAKLIILGTLTLFFVGHLQGCSAEDSATGESPAQGDVGPADIASGDVLMDILDNQGDISRDLESSIPEDTPENELDVSPECEPGTGCFGEPCSSNEDCIDGICISDMGSRVCSEPCLEDCPQGWKCKQIQLSGSDLIFACVSDFMHLCQPCRTNNDCLTGEIQDVCIDYGAEGAFCGATCTETEECPSGFECMESSGTEGGSSKQCVNMEGVCECSEWAIDAGLPARCSISNEYGVCEGERICAADGLGECDAATPAEDLCNGLDDDCNGSTDELPCEDENPCTEDSCNGEAGCLHEPTPGESCDDGDPGTKNDICDASGACAGEAFTCEIEGQCVQDSVPNGSTCEVIYKVAGSDCDDGDLSTKKDRCTIDGLCSGTPYTCEPGECHLSAEPDGIGCKLTYKTTGTFCGEAGSTCSGQDTCNQFGQCVSNDFEEGTHCGDSGADCINQDLCDGKGGCVDQGFWDDESACGDSGAECINQDRCDSTGNCIDKGLWNEGDSCGEEATECSAQDTCNAEGECLANHVKNETPCGDPASDCVYGDLCDGAGECIDKGFWEDGSLCGGGDTECSNQDTCNAIGVCEPNHKAVATLCGDPISDCVNADYCDGAGICKDAGFWNEGSTCGDEPSPCSEQDTCDDSGQCLPNDLSADTSCGDAGSACIHADFCDGTGACMDNGFVSEGTNCGEAATECSGQDTCDATGQCLRNHLDTSTQCGDAESECINPDFCDGTGVCTDNGFVTEGTNCGEAATECSAQDTCDDAGQCLSNHYYTTTPCGDAASQCVIQDLCDGEGVCKDNGFMSEGTSCGEAATECSGQDTCDDGGVCQAHDLPESTPCGSPGSECVNGDTCNDSGTCAENGFRAAGDACGDSSAECINQDICDDAGACIDQGYWDENSSCTDGDLTTQNDLCSVAGFCAGTSYACEPKECEASSTPDGTDCVVVYEENGAPCSTGVCEDGACVGCVEGSFAACNPNCGSFNTANSGYQQCSGNAWGTCLATTCEPDQAAAHPPFPAAPENAGWSCHESNFASGDLTTFCMQVEIPNNCGSNSINLHFKKGDDEAESSGATFEVLKYISVFNTSGIGADTFDAAQCNGQEICTLGITTDHLNSIFSITGDAPTIMASLIDDNMDHMGYSGVISFVTCPSD